MNTRTLELDISKEGAGTCIKVGQGDDGGTTIKALIYDNGAEFELSGATAWLGSSAEQAQLLSRPVLGERQRRHDHG